MINFAYLQGRVIDKVRERLRNGEMTERGFARSAGISQPHLNKVFKGIRSFLPRASISY